jgi:hypothetical protein
MRNRENRHAGCLSICSAIGIFFLWCLFALPAFAANVEWLGGEYPDWSISENWDGGLVPLPGDDVYIQDGTYVNYDHHYDTTAGIASLTIDNFSVLELLPGSETLTVGLGNPTGGFLKIGDTSSGTLAQDGGQVYVDATYGALILGNQSGSEGYYELINGNLTITGIEEYIGASGSGYFYQYGGTHQFSGAMYLGTGEWGNTDSDAYGLYEMNGGTLQSGPGGGGIAIGEWGATGEFIQSGGTVEISDLTLARQVGSTGTYELNDAYGDSTLIVNGEEKIGNMGEGIFTQTGGTHTADTLIIGANGYYYPTGSPSSGTGSYTLNVQMPIDDSSHLSANNLIIGQGGTGIFKHQDGRVTINNDIILGQNIDMLNSVGEIVTLNGNGTYNMDNGELLINGWAYIGDTGTGTVNQTGGEVELTGGSADLHLGFQASGHGTYSLSEGSLYAGWQYVGYHGTGIFDQISGDNTAYWEFNVGTEPGSQGTYFLRDGNLNTVNAFIANNSGSQGDFFQNGGRHTVGSQLTLGNQSGSNSAYYLDGGILTATNEFIGNNGAGVFNQTGGANYIGVDPDTNDLVDPNALSELIVARFEGSSGTYNLSNTAVLHAAREIVGDAGFSAPSTGVFVQNGASEHVVYNDLIIGQDPMSTGSFTISDIAGLTVKGNVFLGDEGGTGGFIQSGYSTVTIENTLHTGSSSESGSNPGIGTYEMQNGTLNAANVNNNGTFLFEGGSMNVTGEFVNTGLFQGKGYADTAVFSNSGTVEIGDSPGELSFMGDYIQTPEGVLVIELGGYEPGMEFDFLNIDGQAELGGELRVTLWDGFNPVSGDQFDIIHVVNGILTGFDQVDLPLGWNWEIAYLDLNLDATNETVRLTANSVPVPATLWLLGTGLIAFVGIRRRMENV